MLSASFLYSGCPDYFSGHACKESEYLLYAYYGRYTTLRDIIEELVDDSWNGPASEDLPEEVTNSDVCKALLDMLSDLGRANYWSGAIAECAANMDRLTECPDCEVELDGDTEYDCCPECGEWFDQDESPTFIVLLTYEEPEIEFACPEYAESTGCKGCSAYDDCGDREDSN